MQQSAPRAALVPPDWNRKLDKPATQLPDLLGIRSGVVCYLLTNYSPPATFSPYMPLLPRKGLLAIAAVIDVAVQAPGCPISAKTLAARHALPPRHLESVLQNLVREGILKGIRGPRGGYELAREARRVTANDILRAAGTVDEADNEPVGSELLSKVVLPALSAAEQQFGVALGRINLEDMARDAEELSMSFGRAAAARA